MGRIQKSDPKNLPASCLLQSPNACRIRESKSITEAMLFPPSMKEAQENPTTPPDLLLNDGEDNVPFTTFFKYLGSYIMTDLSNETEVSARIRKANTQMGMLKDFFLCKGIDTRVKYWISIGGPINTLLWGAKS